MTGAGAYTIGGLLVVTALGGGWLVARLAQCFADELRIFVRRQGQEGQSASGQHAADADAQRTAMVCIEGPVATFWFAAPRAYPADAFVRGGVIVHKRSVESETTAGPRRNFTVVTGGRAHG